MLKILYRSPLKRAIPYKTSKVYPRNFIIGTYCYNNTIYYFFASFGCFFIFLRVLVKIAISLCLPEVFTNHLIQAVSIHLILFSNFYNFNIYYILQYTFTWKTAILKEVVPLKWTGR